MITFNKDWESNNLSELSIRDALRSTLVPTVSFSEQKDTLNFHVDKYCLKLSTTVSGSECSRKEWVSPKSFNGGWNL